MVSGGGAERELLLRMVVDSAAAKASIQEYNAAGQGAASTNRAVQTSASELQQILVNVATGFQASGTSASAAASQLASFGATEAEVASVMERVYGATVQQTAANAAHVSSTSAVSEMVQVETGSMAELQSTLAAGLAYHTALATASGELAVSEAAVGTAAVSAAASVTTLGAAETTAAASGWAMQTADEALFTSLQQTVAAEQAAAAGAEEDAAAFASAGGGASSMTSMMLPLVAAVGSFIALRLADELNQDSTRFANFGSVGSATMAQFGDSLNHGFGLGIDSAHNFMQALAPFGGVLAQIEGGNVNVADTARIAAQAQNLQAAAGVSLSEATQEEIGLMRDFHLSASDAKTVVDALYDSHVRTGQSTQALGQAYGFVHEQLSGLNPSLDLVKQLVDSAAQGGSINTRVLNEEAKAVNDWASGNKTAGEELSRVGLQVGIVNGQIVILNKAHTDYRDAAKDATAQTDTFGGMLERVGHAVEDAATFVGQHLAIAAINTAEMIAKLDEGIGLTIEGLGKLTRDTSLEQWGKSFNDASAGAIAAGEQIKASFEVAAGSGQHLAQGTTAAGQAAAQYGPDADLAATASERLAAGYETEAEKLQDTKKAHDLLYEAQILTNQGHSQAAALVLQESQALNDHNRALADDLAQQARVSESQDSLNTKIGKEGVAAAKEATREVESLGAAQARLSQDSDQLATFQDKLAKQEQGSIGQVTQAQIQSDQERVASARAAADQAGAAYAAAAQKAIQDGTNVSQEQQKLDQDEVNSTRATAESKLEILTTANSELTAAQRDYESQVKQSGDLQLKTMDDIRAAEKNLAETTHTDFGQLPANISSMFQSAASQVQDVLGQIVAADRQAQQDIGTDAEATDQAKIASLRGWLAEDQQVYAEAKQVATDWGKAEKDAADAAKKEKQDLISLTNEEDAAERKLADDAHSAAERATSDAASVQDAQEKLGDAYSKLASDVAKLNQQQQQTASASKTITETAASATISIATQNDGLKQQTDYWTSVRDNAQSVLDTEKQQVQALTDQASAIQQQITLATDLLAAQGMTTGTDKNLLQLQVQRDQLVVQGQSTAEIDKQIAAEQANLQLAKDQNDLNNVDLQQKAAGLKVAQEKLALDQGPAQSLAQQQVTAASAMLASFQGQSAAIAATNQSYTVLLPTMQQATKTTLDFGSATQSNKTTSSSAASSIQSDQENIENATKRLNDAVTKGDKDKSDSARKYQEDATDANRKIGEAQQKLVDDTGTANDTLSKDYKQLNQDINTYLSDPANGAFAQMKMAAEASVNKITTTTLPSLVTAVQKTSDDTKTAANDIGTAIDVGLGQGIDSLGGMVADAGTNLVDEVFQAMRAAAQISSPSAVAAGLGGYVGQGLALGLSSQHGGVSGAGEGLIMAALGPMIATANHNITNLRTLRALVGEGLIPADIGASMLRQGLFGSERQVQNMLGFQDGGLITEPVLGYGVNSGQGYSFGKAGPEWVVPAGAGGMGGGQQINLTINVQGGVFGDQQAAAQQLGGAILDSLRPWLRTI